jgi:hypothetical protein
MGVSLLSEGGHHKTLLFTRSLDILARSNYDGNKVPAFAELSFQVFIISVALIV